MLETANIQKIRRFASLESSELEWIAQCILERTYEKGETIFREGSEPYSLRIISSGYVKISRAASGRQQALLQVFGPQDALGEVALLKGTSLLVTAVALTPVRFLELTQADFTRLRGTSIPFLEATLSAMAGLAQSYMHRIAGFQGETVERRLVYFFLSLCERMGIEQKQGIRLPFSLTRAELASVVDSRTETVIRILSRWEKEKRLSNDERGFLVSKAMFEQVESF